MNKLLSIRCHDWLRNNGVTLAWAILGASVAVCLMYSQIVFHSEIAIPFVQKEPEPRWTNVEILGWTVFRGRISESDAERVVDSWYFATIAALAGLGARIGVAVVRYLPRRFRQAGPTDRWLWFLTTGLVAAFLIIAGVPGQDRSSLISWIIDTIESPWPVGVGDIIWILSLEGLKLVIFAVPVGWAMQTILVTFGLRLSRVPDLQEAANYEDRKVPQSPS